jgi:hypothetical protein
MKDLARTKQELIGEISILKQKTMKLEKSEAKRKQAEDVRHADLRFFESMEEVNRTMQGANDLKQIMSDLIGAALSIFDCDRTDEVCGRKEI